MSTDNAPPTSAPVGLRLRRFLWDGVLPEALGLGFVAIIFGGFVAAYFIADHAWSQQAAAARQAEAQTLAQAAATSLGALGEDDESGARLLFQELGRLPTVHSIRWTNPAGSTRLAWPPTLVTGAAANTPKPDAWTATAPVRSATGANLGSLSLVCSAPQTASFRSTLLWTWGIAAGITLLVFAFVYHRLRRHLKPVAAIERNLLSYASGVERELVTLMLSDSLGSVAQGWNALIRQLADIERKVKSTQNASQSQEVLARFEGAVFRRLIDHLPFGVLCIGEDRVVKYANAAAGALLHRDLDALVGHVVDEGFDNAAIAQAIAGARARTGASLTVDDTHGEGEQEVTLRYRIMALPGRSGGGEMLVTIEDIGQLRENERARDNFLYHVTHELRTPLTNIHAYVETLMQPDFDDEQTRKECYNVIISETRRLSRLVEDILSVSQLEVGTARLDMNDVDLLRLMRQMVQDNLGGADEKQIDLTLSLPPKVPKIKGDKQRLAVLLNNLIGNAIKYTPNEGKVNVQVEVADQSVQIAISDTGIGIAPDDQAHVFDKFYRAADNAVQEISGTGLGLALAREVARLHGGDIKLESELGKGSTFTVELPVSIARHAEVAKA